MDPKLLRGSRIIVSDPDPAKHERYIKMLFLFEFWTVGLCTVGLKYEIENGKYR